MLAKNGCPGHWLSRSFTCVLDIRALRDRLRVTERGCLKFHCLSTTLISVARAGALLLAGPGGASEDVLAAALHLAVHDRGPRFLHLPTQPRFPARGRWWGLCYQAFTGFTNPRT